MSKISKKVWGRLRRHPWRWVFYIVITLIGVGVEMGGELFALLGISTPSGTPLALSMLYQRFVTAGYNKPRRLFVRIVVLSPSYEPQSIFGDVCKKREFEAALLRSLAKFSPSMIVLDFWYAPRACNDGDDANRQAKLLGAVADLSRQFPVVLGNGSQTEHEMELSQDPSLPELKKAGLGARDQILDPKLDFRGADLTDGLVRIDADTRRIPISWQVFPSKSAVLSHSQRKQLPSLSYAAAKKHDPQLQQVISKILAADEHPFTSFISEEDFGPIHAIDLVCGHALTEEDWTNCISPDVLSDTRFGGLKGGQIVLVAENSLRDHYESVLGEVPGYVLQANYIEALVGKSRFFRPLAAKWELLLTGTGVVVIIILFDVVAEMVTEMWAARRRRWPSAAGSLAAILTAFLLIICCAVLCNLIAIYGGWFLGFWLALVPVPIVELLFRFRKSASVQEPAEPDKASKPNSAGVAQT